DSYARHAHMAFVLEIIRQPACIQPKRIDRTKEARNHAPGGSVSEEPSPLGEGRRTRGGVFVTLGEVADFFRGKLNFRGIAMNAPPYKSKDDARRADDHEHPAPAQCEHQKREQRDGDEVAEGRGGLQQAGGEAPFAKTEPVPYYSGSARKQGRFA